MTASPFPADGPANPPSRRSHAYLRLCGLESARAGALAAQPVERIQEDLDAWAQSLGLRSTEEMSVTQKACARARLFLAAVPARWPAHFLKASPPPELAAAAHAIRLEPMRPLRQTNMAPQPIDLGPVGDVADETWRTFDTWPVLRGLTIWLLFALLLVSVFYVVRF